MNGLQIGFGRSVYTPPPGLSLAGYFRTRKAEGTLDDLEINGIAFAAGTERALLLSLDHLGLEKAVCDEIRRQAESELGIPAGNVMVHCTHTHTAPYFRREEPDPLNRQAFPGFVRKTIDCARMALSDLEPARMEYGTDEAKGIAFVRRYLLEDGTVRTNPGKKDPRPVRPAGRPDERVFAVRFSRKDGGDVILISFGCHPDTTGGCLYSADFPGVVRRETEKNLPGSHCVFCTGPQGDVNHVDRISPPVDFRGYDRNNAVLIGQKVTEAALRALTSSEQMNAEQIICAEKSAVVSANLPRPEDIPEARRIKELYLAGQTDRIPFQGSMMRNARIAEALRMVSLADGPEMIDLPLTGISIGPLTLLGIPGEPFTEIGLRLREADPSGMVLPFCNTNAKEGYLPTEDAFLDEGGYEARSSRFKPGVAQEIIQAGTALIDALISARSKKQEN